MWVLKRTNDDKYVRKSGGQHSYTTSIIHAQKFETEQMAIDNSCVENEYPVRIDTILNKGK